MDFMEAILAFWPVIVLQLALMVAGLIDLYRRKTVKTLSLGIWTVIIVLVSIIGPVLYFILGRGEE